MNASVVYLIQHLKLLIMSIIKMYSKETKIIARFGPSLHND